MSKQTPPNDITQKRVVYNIPGMEEVPVRRDVEYGVTEAGPLMMDLYYPRDSKAGARTPAVVFVSGYSDIGFERMLGCKLKEMGSYISWGQLTAASGLVAVTYSATKPAEDIFALLDHVQNNAESLGIDENRIAIWACSGNAPNALAVLMRKPQSYLKCAVLCYGVMLDLDGHTSTAESAKQFGFVNPSAGKSVEDLPPDVPLLIVRAGRDQMPHLNETLDRFVAKALSCNLPLTVVNQPTAPHAFDVLDDCESTREIVRQMLAFMRFHLLAPQRSTEGLADR